MNTDELAGDNKGLAIMSGASHRDLYDGGATGSINEFFGKTCNAKLPVS